jgi:hypothetical protein
MSEPRYTIWPRVEVVEGPRGLKFVQARWLQTAGGYTIVLTHPSEDEIAEARAEVEQAVREEAEGRRERAN